MIITSRLAVIIIETCLVKRHIMLLVPVFIARENVIFGSV